MNLLIIGGTVFLGRSIVELALERGHQVTLFHRGRHNPGLFPECDRIIGDRLNAADLAPLRGRTWDAVIDPSGYFPRAIELVADAVGENTGHYTFVSSVSVYPDVSTPNMDESAPVGTIDNPTIEEITAESYGPLKALCEAAALRRMPGRVLNVRAGLIVGPHDPSDRFTYWPRRIARGGAVLAPGSPDAPTQFIDVRDLAEWIVRCAESGTVGTYNATGPATSLTLGRLLDRCIAVAQSGASLEWVSDEFLIAHGVGPWIELPLWIPAEQGAVGFNTINCDRAMQAGLDYRPVEDTIRATLDWDSTTPDRVMRAGLAAEREESLLALWRQRERG